MQKHVLNPDFKPRTANSHQRQEKVYLTPNLCVCVREFLCISHAGNTPTHHSAIEHAFI